ANMPCTPHMLHSRPKLPSEFPRIERGTNNLDATNYAMRSSQEENQNSPLSKTRRYLPASPSSDCRNPCPRLRGWHLLSQLVGSRSTFWNITLESKTAVQTCLETTNCSTPR